MTLSNFVELLPENFKQISDPTQSDALALYTLNPLLVTAYLIDVINTNNIYTNSLEDFKRTYRLKDTILDPNILYQKEIYKGYLAFKSTSNDLVYYLKQLGIDATITELTPSGSIDYQNFKYINGSFFLDGSYVIPNNILTISGNSNYCEIGISITVNLIDGYNTSDNISLAYNKISSLLLNRLSALTVLGPIDINLNISGNFDLLSKATESMSGTFTFSPSENLYDYNYINNITPFTLNLGEFISQNYMTETPTITN
jgi:hypothetical protein